MDDAEYEKLRSKALHLCRQLRAGNRVPRKLCNLLEGLACCRYCESRDYEPLPMLKRDVWLKAVPDGHGCICQACLQERLGRPLVRADLSNPDDWS